MNYYEGIGKTLCLAIMLAAMFIGLSATRAEAFSCTGDCDMVWFFCTHSAEEDLADCLNSCGPAACVDACYDVFNEETLACETAKFDCWEECGWI